MTTPRAVSWLAGLLLSLGLGGTVAGADEADPILHHGKVVTVDRDPSVRRALAVQGDRLLRFGTDQEALRTRDPLTEVIDLGSKSVLPGLIDSHTHPTGASPIEFDRPVPEMETVRDVPDYVRSRAGALGPGKRVVVSQVFITRLKQRHYPTRDEPDRAAPEIPVLFSTGPDASLNSLALKLSGIEKDFQPEGPGKDDQLRYFHPLRILFAAGVVAGGGSDHMRKVGSLRPIDLDNPSPGMWVAIAWRAKGHEGRLHLEEALAREEALRSYTINNARLPFQDERIGSLEEDKQADLIVLDRDLLTCPEDEVRQARALATYLDGKRIFERRE